MKKFLLAALTAHFILSISSIVQCQIINDNINIEYGLLEYGADVYESPGSTSNAEPTVRLTMETTEGDYIAEICEAWNGCFGSGCLSNYNGNIGQDFATGLPYDVLIQFRMEGWENDDVTGCDYNEVDENHVNELVVGQWSNNTITFNRKPCKWYANWSDDDMGLHVGAPGINYYQAIPTIIYRYNAGNTYGNPLKFGELSGDQTVTHENSTIEQDGLSTNFVYYTDEGGNFTPDVFYSFTIMEPSLVTISAAGSSFDTNLQLFSPSGIPLAFNDDVSVGILTSLISEELCAGEYVFRIEGSGILQSGEIDVSVQTEVLEPLSISANVNDVSCAGDNDGSVVLFVTGGIPPYSGYWPNDVTGLQVGGLEMGTYNGYVQHQCPGNLDFAVEIENGDVTAPEFFCPSYSEEIEPNGSFTLSEATVLSDMAPSDNCGDVFIDYTTMTFDQSDLGNNSILVTVTDEAGNASTCEIVVTISGPTSLQELDSDIAFQLYPNPVDNTLSMHLMGRDLNGNYQVEILDITGKRVMLNEWFTDQTPDLSFDVSELNSGLYIFKLKGDFKVVETRFIKY